MQWCSYFDLLVFCVKTKDKIKGEVNFCQNQLQIRINPKSTGLFPPSAALEGGVFHLPT